MNIAIVLFDGAEELDWAGPWEVLAAWSRIWPDDGVTVYTVADSLDPVACAKGLRVLPEHTWESAPKPDVVVWPGGVGAREQIGVEAVRERVRSLAATGALMTSVCTGALVYADAGLLDGRPATTWHGAVERLAELGARADGDSRFVDDGDVVTSAGVSAGIDMALHLSGACTRSSGHARCAATSSTTPNRPSRPRTAGLGPERPRLPQPWRGSDPCHGQSGQYGRG